MIWTCQQSVKIINEARLSSAGRETSPCSFPDTDSGSGGNRAATATATTPPATAPTTLRPDAAAAATTTSTNTTFKDEYSTSDYLY